MIELMVTVLIVAILTAIAYPNYRNYVIRGQLVDATQGLSALSANMERYFQDNRTYAIVAGLTHPCASASYVVGHFTLSCTISSSTTYSAQAVGTTGQLAGFVFTVDQSNNQATTITSPPAPSSWQTCSTAWVTRPGGC